MGTSTLIGLDKTIPTDITIRLSDPKAVYEETGCYSVHPDETVRRVRQFFPKIGVTHTELIDLDITDNIPIVRVNKICRKPKCHRQAVFWSSPPTPLNNPTRNCFGKGMTLAQSRASAVMEAVERYCGQQFSHNQSFEADYRQVEGYALDPGVFVFPEPPIKCQTCPEKDISCLGDLGSLSHEWTWGYSLLYHRPTLVPSTLVYYPYMFKDGRSFIFNDTGGLSAGNTLEEAILQAISEIIERDALHHVLNSGHLDNLRHVDFRNSRDMHLIQFMQKSIPADKVFSLLIRNEGLQINVPTFAAFVCYQIGDNRMYFGGSGTSLNPIMGLLRALTELEQQKIRQNITFRLDQDFLVCHNGDQMSQGIHLSDIPNRSTGFIGQDIITYLNGLSKYCTDVVVVNLTHPEIGIPVVRVIIPQLIAYSGSDILESVFLKIMNVHEDENIPISENGRYSEEQPRSI